MRPRISRRSRCICRSRCSNGKAPRVKCANLFFPSPACGRGQGEGALDLLCLLLLILLFLRRSDETRLTSVWGLVRRPGGRVTFSVSPEKVTKERRPTRPRSPMKPATARGRSGGSLTGHPWPDSERARLVRAPLRAFSFAPSPRPRGTREARAEKREAKKDLVVPAQAGTQRLCSCSALRSQTPLCRGEGRTEKPRAPHAGGARDRADSIVRPGMACRSNPSARSEPAALRPARHRGRVLFGDFLLHEQEKVTRRPGWPARPTRT